MFTRIVELLSTPGRAREVVQVLRDKALPRLRTQPGFVDGLLLLSDAEPDRIVAVTTWQSRQDAERYHQREYPKIVEAIGNLLEFDPLIRTFKVEIVASSVQSAARK